jgi:MFS family permease
LSHRAQYPLAGIIAENISRPGAAPQYKSGIAKIVNQTIGKLFSVFAIVALVAGLHGAVLAQLFVGLADPRAFAEQTVISQRAVMFLWAFIICQLIALPAWGALSDRISPKGLLLFSTGVVLVGSLVPLTFALPVAFPRPIITRALFGLGAAGLVLALSFAANRMERVRRPVAVAPLLAAFWAGGGAMMACHWLCRRWDFEPRVALAATSSLLLLLSILALITAAVWLDEPRPKSENYRGINALHHLWHGVGLLWSQAGFAVIMLLVVGGFASAQALLWVAPSTLLGAAGPSGAGIAASVILVLPWCGAAVGAATFRLFALASRGARAVSGLIVAGLLLLLAVLAAWVDAGWLVRTMTATAMGYCSAVLTALALAAVVSSSRSRVLGAVIGAAFSWWLVGFALSAVLVLGQVSADSHRELAYALIGASALGLAVFPFVGRSPMAEETGGAAAAAER